MKHDIKFRAWNKIEKKMYFWDKEPYLSFFIGDYGDRLANAFKEANATEFMQYTGISDMEATEIYEGDIIDYVSWRFRNGKYSSWTLPSRRQFPKIVKWNEKRAAFNIIRSQHYKVIGNIYENPELIK